jgi:hypothetical protein
MASRKISPAALCGLWLALAAAAATLTLAQVSVAARRRRRRRRLSDGIIFPLLMPALLFRRILDQTGA